MSPTSMKRSSLRFAAAIAAMSLVVTACGARWPAEQDSLARAGGGDGLNDPALPGGPQGQDPLNPNAPAPGGENPTTGPTVGPGEPTGGPSTRQPSIPVNAGPRPGVTATEINVCVLVPLTGASPIPTSWDKGANLYWDYLRKQGRSIFGRYVKLNVKDTESQVASALAAARECIAEKAFSFFTLDRLDVSRAVTQFLHDQGFPNVAFQNGGVLETSKGASQTNTFQINIGLLAQGRLVADYMMTGDLAGKRYAIVHEDNKENEEFTAALRGRMRERGTDVVTEETIDGQGNDYSSTVLRLKNADADVVFVASAPTPFIKLAQQSQGAAYHPTWVGAAGWWCYNTVAQVGNSNGAMEGARSFSTWVALSSPAANEYKAAYKAMYPNETADDIGLVSWGIGEVLEAALRAAGPNLGHNTLRAALQSLKVTPKTWSPQSFTPGSRIGSNKVLEFRIEGDHWKQVGGYRSSF